MNNLKLALAACAALCFCSAACSNTANTNQTAGANARPAATTAPLLPAATPDEFAEVRGIYSGVCARCHQQNGTGGPFRLEDGTKLDVPSLREHGLKDSDEHLAKQIRNGGEGMPAFKTRLSEEQIGQLVRFVRKEFHGRDTPAAKTSASPAAAHD